MRFSLRKCAILLGASMATMAVAAPAFAQADEDNGAAQADEMIIVTGLRTTYTNNVTTEPMLMQQTPLTSPLSMIDNLPGVSVNEGDTFGFDDWSTTVAIRGFQTNLDTQQVGITIDGMPNGNSNYGGGAKANRYIDSMDIGSVAVSQGTADIASRSNEALGGTLDFRTSDPLSESRIRFSTSLGQYDAQRFYVRGDTGDLGGVKAWVSASHQEATDWIEGSAQNRRDHIAAKFVAEPAMFRITGYASYDDTHEDNYEQLYDAASFVLNPDSDTLQGNWSGIPWIDQMYRRGWSTLRENFFTYLKADAELGHGINLTVGGYYHKNKGRGDWLPPYIVDVFNDGAGNPHSELSGASYDGGPALGRIYFVDAQGHALSPIVGCESTLTFPYGGAGPEYDPACYAPGALAVQSYRHTNYRKSRIGGIADASWTAEFTGFENTLRAGIWYEDVDRDESRTWHKVIDTRAGYDFVKTPYWTQYDREYPQSTFKWYAEDSLTFGGFTATAGVKQFQNDVGRRDNFGASTDVDFSSTSDLLFSGGMKWEVTDQLEIFGGYAENYKAIGDSLLENPDADFSQLEPETSRNIDAGIRYNSSRVTASVSVFDIEFKNRIIFLAAGSVDGIDYLEETTGTYFNSGGLESQGLEAVVNVQLMEGLSAYASYTYTKAKFLGTGNPDIDEEIGIVPGNRVPGIPEHMFVASLDWNSGPYRAGLSGKYTGERFVNISNDWQADGHFVADLYLGVAAEEISAMLKGLDLSLVVNNVFDKSYLGGISGGAAWIGAPRTVVFTATFDF